VESSFVTELVPELVVIENSGKKRVVFVRENTAEGIVYKSDHLRFIQRTNFTEAQVEFQLFCSFLDEIRIQKLSLLFAFVFSECTYLNRNYAWERLSSRQVVINDLSPFQIFVNRDNQNYIISSTGIFFCPVILSKNGREARLEIVLDYPALHPHCFFHKGKKRVDPVSTWHSGEQIEISFTISKAAQRSSTKHLPLVSRYPGGARACYIITDHPDFDTGKKLQVFLKGENDIGGWLGKNLRMTKGVFKLRSDPQFRKKSDSLEDTEYLNLIQELHKSGSEIAPHALSHSGNLTPEMFEKGLQELSREFHPQTWIDHGTYIKYCYSVGGAESSQYRLIDHLNELRYQAIWSYYDLPIEPAFSLNHLSLKRSTLSFYFNMIVEKIRKGNTVVAFHYLRNWFRIQAANNILLAAVDSLSAIGEWMYRSLKRPMNFLKLFRKLRSKLKENLVVALNDKGNGLNPREIISFSPILFGLPRKPFYFTDSQELVLFTTSEATHTEDAYTIQNLDNLIDEYGLHIGHTYLLNSLSHLKGILRVHANSISLSPGWVNFVEYLSAKTNEGKIWNCPLAEFAKYLKALKKVRVSYDEECRLYLTNLGKDEVRGLSAFVDSGVPVQNIRWNDKAPENMRSYADRHVIWGNLRPAEQVVVEAGA